jgi:hypothetical protein
VIISDVTILTSGGIKGFNGMARRRFVILYSILKEAIVPSETSKSLLNNRRRLVLATGMRGAKACLVAIKP